MWTRLRDWWRGHPHGADVTTAAAVFLAAVVIRPDGPTSPSGIESGTAWLLAAACLALVWRRSQPVAVWAIATATGFLGVVTADGPSPVVLPAFVAVYTVATHRRRAVAIAAAMTTALAMVVALVITESSAASSPTTYAVLAWGGLAAAIGIAVRSQRALLAAAEERARRAEQSRDEEAQRAVTEERLRIARELHDVVAHHISVINVQAGVARHLLPADPVQAQEALGHIREASQVVLGEMSTILGLLRSPDDASAVSPAPGMEQFDALVDSTRRAGLQVTVRSTGTVVELPPLLDLTVYRLLQEALTNARKHGTGTVDLDLRWAHDLITLDVRNAIATTQGGGTGHGLIGMRERVASVGGRLTVNDDGVFHVHAELPLAGASAPSIMEIQ